MSPRTEFVLSSLLAAALLSIAVVVLMDADRRAPGVAEFAAALRFAPAALLAVGLGAWFATRWHARAHRAGRHWKTGGMTLRLLLVVLLLFPLSLAVWAVTATAIDQVAASRPGGFGEALAWLPVVVFYGSLVAVLFGAAPLFAIEYFVCRRYLRRQAALSTDPA